MTLPRSPSESRSAPPEWRRRGTLGSPRPAADQLRAWHSPCPARGLGFRSKQRPGRRRPRRTQRACGSVQPPPGLRRLTRFLVFLVEFLQHGGAGGAQSSSLALARGSERRLSGGGSAETTSGRPRRPGLCASAMRALRMRTPSGAAPGVNQFPAGAGRAQG